MILRVQLLNWRYAQIAGRVTKLLNFEGCRTVMNKKSDLPEKICPVCERPFTWRKKWQKNWEEIVYCSQKCRRNKNKKIADQ